MPIEVKQLDYSKIVKDKKYYEQIDREVKEYLDNLKTQK